MLASIPKFHIQVSQISRKEHCYNIAIVRSNIKAWGSSYCRFNIFLSFYFDWRNSAAARRGLSLSHLHLLSSTPPWPPRLPGQMARPLSNFESTTNPGTICDCPSQHYQQEMQTSMFIPDSLLVQYHEIWDKHGQSLQSLHWSDRLPSSYNPVE